MIFLSNSLETEEEDEESKMESIPTAKQSAKKMKTNWLRFQSWVCDLYRLSGAIDYSSELITRWLISKSLSLSLSLSSVYSDETESRITEWHPHAASLHSESIHWQLSMIYVNRFRFSGGQIRFNRRLYIILAVFWFDGVWPWLMR